MNCIDLNGRTAVVTGAAGGIGMGIAQRLAASGARVAIWDINEASLLEQVSTLPELSSAFIAACDVTDGSSVRAALECTQNALGNIDILVNCAGIVGPNLPLVDYPAEQFDSVIRVSVHGTFNCCQAVVPSMVESGWGRIVNFSSMAGKEGNPNASAYSAAKAGVIALTKSLGKELATSGVCVNAVAPAVIKTAMADAVTPEQLKYMLERIPMGRMGTVAEAASLVAWLCSDECSFSTSAVFDLSGGRATY